jgi:hypothetical protein
VLALGEVDRMGQRVIGVWRAIDRIQDVLNMIRRSLTGSAEPSTVTDMGVAHNDVCLL